VAQQDREAGVEAQGVEAQTAAQSEAEAPPAGEALTIGSRVGGVLGSARAID
jgi:hypothetical protein